MKVVAVAVLVAVLVAVANADFEDQMTDGLGGLIKGAGKKLGVDVCDAEHVGAGILVCPGPGMPADSKFCCYSLGGEPACCNWLGKNLRVILGVVAAVVVLITIACCLTCCCCCGCCCFGKKPQQPVFVVAQPPTTYPNHPHERMA